MAPSFDYMSSLLCAEENISILEWDEEVGLERESHGNPVLISGFMGLDVPLQSDDCMGLLVSKEGDFLPRDDYLIRLQSGVLDSSLRREAVNWIWKVHGHYSFQPLTTYLSVNYLDRFLSCYELPQGKAWMIQLLSVACLSLAAKMEETDVPLSLDLQVGEAKYVFESRTIQRMELLVLSNLKWRMQSVTPFSFVDYFLHKINGDDSWAPRAYLCRSSDIILTTIKGTEFLEFRPSEIAAAVAISVSEESKSLDFNNALACCPNVEKGKVLRCYELIQEIVLIKNQKLVKIAAGSVSSVPQSPIGVLDAACLSYKSDDKTVGSCSSSHTSPATKRRKLNRVAEGT
ncbi:cyclin-D3-1 [Amborella trichopoda]|uniref:Cyclin N-terminal domain-containing protein n=1 Tax=Amborella trichopoda TaxID=13333 RepID=W1P5G1_AMBTC|nr:cyclin-D3-1 [Amborella trichopoda]ERN02909.1 hypothetical protein AMTR_s00135p00066200 [Amborella trichopoda]|eukprot:XP_006841234.3 cyclin-D3-1 [Amborella trichopoda]